MLYRDFVRRNACNLGLTGFVRNLKDGKVEVVAEGEEDKLQDFLTSLKKGSFFSKVEGVEVVWREAEQKFSDFKIIYYNFVDRF